MLLQNALLVLVETYEIEVKIFNTIIIKQVGLLKKTAKVQVIVTHASVTITTFVSLG